MKPSYVSLKTKLGVAAVIVLVEAILFGGCWAAAAIGGGGRSGPELPPLASLTETSGTVVGFSTSHSRNRSYYAPIVEFSADSSPQQIATRSGYNREAIPFSEGDAVLVLYERTRPAEAWLKWEYERYVQEASTPRFADIAETFLARVGLGIIAITLVLLLVYFLKPIKAD